MEGAAKELWVVPINWLLPAFHAGINIGLAARDAVPVLRGLTWGGRLLNK